MLQLLLIASLTNVLVAQTETDVYSAGDFTITWTSPTTYDGNLDCEATTSTCKPLNADACSEVDDPTTARSIELELTYASSTVTITSGSQLYIWLQKGTGSCTFDQVPELIAQEELTATDPLVSNLTFDFPSDLSTALTFDTTDIFEQDDACGETAINETIYRLCFGVDLGGLTAVDNKVSSSEPHGYAQFKVDTSIPAAPKTPTLTALDGRIGINLEMDDSSTSETIGQWEIWSKVSAENNEDSEEEETTSVETCTDWNSAEVTVTLVSALTETTASSELNAKNGTSYDLCAFAIDNLGNRGAASAIASATPQEECDFLECYPGELKTGYCGALPAANIFAWLGLLGLGFLGRQRRRL